MKLKILLYLVLITTSIGIAQDDSLYVQIKSDTLLVCNTNLWCNCAFSPVIYIDIVDSSIKVTEKDTSRYDQQTTCGTYKNYYIPITGLAEGKYILELWRGYSLPYYPDTAAFVKSIEFDFIITSLDNEPEIVDNFRLNQNYPNPFNPSTTITYELPANKESYTVALKIYNSLGELVKVLVNTNQSPGIYNVQWNGKDRNGFDVPSGMYLYTLEAGSIRLSKKMMLLR